MKDICFLHRYNAPVLLILHEAGPTWPGRYKEAKDSCELIAISLDLSGGSLCCMARHSIAPDMIWGTFKRGVGV